MKVALQILVVGIAFSAAFGQDTRREVCYDHYGCFSTDAPWTSLLRPLSALPAPPYEIGTRYLLFCRGSDEYLNIGYELMVDKDAILDFSPFDPARKTVFLIHGFTDSHKSSYVWDAKDALLENEDINVIAVDWAPGAKSPYLGATANARLVGAQTARMVYFLEEKGGLNIDDVHIIGHNLGAHVAGYIGDRTLGRLPRITAIDPSAPYFDDTDPIVRLDKADAKYVEVVHTNGNTALNLGMGIVGPIGHVDIFPNGGKHQPGCQDLLGNLIISIIDLITLNFEGAISTWACSHLRGADFFVESIRASKTCPFVSYACKDYAEFEKGNCYNSCREPGACVPLGYNSKNYVASGSYFLHTGDGANNQSYCLQSVQLQALLKSTQERGTGTFTIQVRSEDGTKSDKYTLLDDSGFAGGQILSRWVEIPSHILRNPTDKNSLILHYTRGGLLPGNQPKTLAFDSINLLAVDTEFNSQTITYKPVTIDYATDTQISD